MAEIRPSPGAPTGALFRLVPAQWGTLGRYAGLTLFLVWMGTIVMGGGRSLSDGVGFEAALFWLLAPTLALVAGHLPGSLEDGLAASPLTRSLPGLRRGMLRAVLLLFGAVGLGVGGTALALGIGGPEAVAASCASLVLFLVPALWTAHGGTPRQGALRTPVSPGLGLVLFLLVLVALHLVWVLAPGLPAEVGGGSPGLVTLISLLLLPPLLVGLVRTHRAERGDWAGPGGAGAEGERRFADLPGHVPARRPSWWRRLSWGVPPSAGNWRERPIRSGIQAGHYARARLNRDSLGLVVEWLLYPVLLIGVGLAFAEFAFALFILGAAVACVHPGLAPVGTLPYPLPRRDRARVVWLAHLAQGLAGVALAASITWGAARVFSPAEFGLPDGAGPFLLLGLIFAWLPLAMVTDTLRRSDHLNAESPAGLPDLRRLAPAGAIFVAVMASLVAIQVAWPAAPEPGQLLPALGLLALVLHGAGWLFLRWHFGRCNLGPTTDA